MKGTQLSRKVLTRALAGAIALSMVMAGSAMAGPNLGVQLKPGTLKPQPAPVINTTAGTQHIQAKPTLNRDKALTIEGEVSLGQAPLSALVFKINGRNANPVGVAFRNIGGEFSNRYHFKITTHLTDPSFTITPAFKPTYTVRGQWNPRNNVIRVPVNKSVRGLVFRWMESNQRTSIPSSTLLLNINGALRGLNMHLNNHGTVHPDSSHFHSWQHNDSYIEYRGSRIPLLLSETYTKIARHHYYYYVNDFNLVNVRASIEGGLIRVAFNFEDADAEVKGHCLIKRSKLMGGWANCPVGSDKGAPDIHLTHPTFVALVQPSAVGGSISFGDIDIRYIGGVRINGALRPLSRLATEKMREAVRKGFTDMISRGPLRDQLAANIRHLLDGLGIGYVTAVNISGSNFNVTYRN